MASLPLVVVAVPVLLFAWLVHAAPEQALASIKDLYDVHAPGGPVVAVGGILGVKWLPMFLVLPIFLPILVAAQSIGGERERRTLEPLLATRVSTLSIVLGKSIAAMVPALAMTWIAAVLFCAGIDAVAGRLLLPHAAQNLSATTVLPLVALLVFELAGRISLGPRFYFALAGGVALADLALIALAIRLFDRERLL